MKMKIEEKIALCAIKHHETSHIVVDVEICNKCETRICLRACPGELYTIDEESGLVRVEHTGCLECGTCLVICPHGAVKWEYPEAGFGVHYRHG